MRHTLRSPKDIARLNCEALEDRAVPAAAFALSGSALIAFDTASPTIVQTTAITGVNGSEVLVGIDFRPQNGLLYGLGVNEGANTATLYTISIRSGGATPVGSVGAIALTDGVNPIDLPNPASSGYGFDFNPDLDRVRVVTSTGLNFRVNPNTGTAVDGDNTGLTSGNVTGTNPDGPISGAAGAVDAAAYTNNQPNNGGTTTLYTLNAGSDALYIQNPANAGTQTLVLGVTLGGNALDFTAVNGFDIPAGVNDDASGTGVTSGSAFAVLNVGGTTALYSIDLTNGQATLIGNVGTGTPAVQGLAIQSDLGGFPAIALDDTGTNLIRFNTASPTTVTIQALGALNGAEVMVGIDFRPATGQLYGLGVDATLNTATLYLIDPQNGGLTVVGTPGQIAFTTDGAVAVDLPTAAAGYGFDFNPDADLIRVVTGTGLNFRVDPTTGAAVDGNNGGAAVTGTNPDGNINGSGATGVTGAAYTNSSGNSTAVTATTLYTLDSLTNRLLVQSSPNGGTQGAPIPVTLTFGGPALDFTDVSGFDIPAGVFVATSNTVVTSGFGYAVLTVAGAPSTTGLYRINLTTGVATLLGNVGAGATPLTGFTLADAPAGAISFTNSALFVTENSGTLTVAATRTGGTSGAVSVTVTVTGGTAVAGTDFTGTPLTLTFADGATTATGTITIADNAVTGANKTIALALAGATNGAVLGATNTATVTIIDNEGAPPLAAGVAYALSGTSLIAFDPANPAAANTAVPITGVNGSETLVDIDFRPQNGLLYGLGYNATLGTVQLYLISTQTGVATAVGTSGTFVDGSGNPVRIGVDATTRIGIDFNPVVDRVRVVTSSGQTFRMDPNTGAFVDGNLGGAANSVGGLNQDGAISGGTTTLNGAAYTNNAPNAATTTLYTLDVATKSLFIQNPPNAGTQSVAKPITLNGAPLNFTAVGGFDIQPGTNAVAGSAPVAGFGLAVLTVGGATRAYSIDLTNGAATLLGPIGAGTAAITGLAFQGNAVATGTPVVGLNTAGTGLVRFNTATPGTFTNVAVTGVDANEVLVGIDFRPATGQLYGLGVNATANNATLYLIDPQTGTATAVGAAGQIAFTTDGAIAVDLPDPATDGYGFDFNPTVDRIRVTTSTGLNFRVNPNTGAPVDGNNGGADMSVNGTNPDGAISGAGVTGVGAAAYTNSFGTGGVPGAAVGTTTLYTLDALSNSLAIQNPANGGTQTALVPITFNGAALDFTAISGFDIPSNVVATANNAAVASGTGIAALVVNGTTNIYSINLVTGAATLLGAAPAGLAGLAIAQTPVGSVGFVNGSFTVDESAGTLTVTLVRTGGSTGPLTVVLTPTAGTAAAGGDFTATPITVTFVDGATTATAVIPITNDAVTEPSKTFTLALSAPTGGAVLGAQTTATVTIADDDTATKGPVAAGPTVTITNPDGSTTTVTPFPGFQGAVTTASGDVNGDGVDDVIAGASVTGHVKVIDGKTGAEIRSFFPFQGFTGGVNVAAGDINNDGVDDIIVGATINGHVKVIDGKTGAEIRSFLAYTNFAGEVRVGSGDIDGDGIDDIITGAGSGALGHVKVFSGATGAEIRSFLAYLNFNGGIFVASGDVDGDGRDDIITGADANGHVKAFSGVGNAEIRSFFAFPGFTGSARVAARDANGDGTDDIIVGAGPGGSGLVRTFNGVTLALLSEATLSDPNNLGIFVG